MELSPIVIIAWVVSGVCLCISFWALRESNRILKEVKKETPETEKRHEAVNKLHKQETALMNYTADSYPRGKYDK